MKYTLQIEGDYYQDRLELAHLVVAANIVEKNERARDYIKKTLKYEVIDDKTKKILEDIMSILNGSDLICN